MTTRHVFRWDLDKTYLRTEFERFRDLVKSAFETAADKQAYPGAKALLRALRQGEGHRICIVSGSPTQMRQVLVAKLALDGVEYDEFVLKNNLKNMLRGRFRALRSQVPYKLPALLESRFNLGTITPPPPETLFGDDAEADAIVYLLYAEVLAGRVGQDELERTLQAARAYPDEIERTLALARGIPKSDAVQRILIHLDQRSPTLSFRKYGRRLVPVFNYFQAALVLYADGVLTARQVLFVALEMLESPEYQLASLANSLQDLVRRNRLSTDVARRLAEEARQAAADGILAGRSDLPPFEDIAAAFVDRLRQLGGATGVPWPSEDDPLDFVSLVDDEHERRRELKRERRARRRP
jgi:hypothetical protein